MSDLCGFRNIRQEARSLGSLQSDLPALCYATETWPDKETASSSMRSISSRIGKMFSEDEPAATMAMPVTKFRPNHKRYVAFDCLFCLTWAVLDCRRRRNIAGLVTYNDKKTKTTNVRVSNGFQETGKKPLGKPPTRWANSFSRSFTGHGPHHWMHGRNGGPASTTPADGPPKYLSRLQTSSEFKKSLLSIIISVI